MTFQIKFHQIRAFVEVARQGSIRGASRTLNLSQPALTKSIKELEEGMAAQLFVRRSKGVALTECGEGFYQRARLILEELRAAQDDIRQRQGELAGQINIGMGASVSRTLMPAVITRFHAQHPQVKVRIMEGQLVSMINELRQGSWISPSTPIIRDLTTRNLRLKNSSRSRLRYFVGKGIRRWGLRLLMNFCIITGQCRRRGEVIINN